GRRVRRRERGGARSRDAVHGARRAGGTGGAHGAQAVRVGSGAPDVPLPQAARPRPRGARADRHDRAGDRPDVRGQVRAPRHPRRRPPQPGPRARARVPAGAGGERVPRAARLFRAGGCRRARGAARAPRAPAAAARRGRGPRGLGGAAVGAGIGPTAIDAVLGVVKAYTTRVGNGPLPTEAEPALAERIRELGGEFGATTGRPRRCGWFDAVVVRYAVRVNGLTGLAVTKLDVLDSFAEIPVCVGYRLDGEPLDAMPAEVERLARV